MKRQGVALIVLSALVCTVVSSKERRTLGDATNVEALLKVHNFCLDQSTLNASQSADVEKFVARASAPRGVLSKMSWRLISDCGQADAIVKLAVAETEELSQTSYSSATGSAATGSVPVPAYKASVAVHDRASGKLLYQVEGESVQSNRQGAIASPFSKLAKDLKTLAK
jgi:hypothetical protein